MPAVSKETNQIVGNILNKNELQRKRTVTLGSNSVKRHMVTVSLLILPFVLKLPVIIIPVING